MPTHLGSHSIELPAGLQVRQDAGGRIKSCPVHTGARKNRALKGKENCMSVVSEFREFAVKGSVIDLAVGVIIGGAFGKIVDSLVKDIIMPVVSLAFGKIDFSNYFLVLGSVPADYHGAMTPADLAKAGLPVFAYGSFITVAVNFLILAFIIFMMVRYINALKKKVIAEQPPAPPAPPAEDVVLLREIRDALRK
jgi:large conductance mechanosensitive channel